MADGRGAFQEQVASLRRTQILDAATAVFAERGFHRTTIRDVAKAAGVADGTIYNYFDNKTALLLGIMDRLNETDRRDEDMARAAGREPHPAARKEETAPRAEAEAQAEAGAELSPVPMLTSAPSAGSRRRRSCRARGRRRARARPR